MAIGDVVKAYSNNVSSNAYLAIQASSTQEWVIHNVYYGGAVEFYLYDGTNEMKFDSDSAFGARLGAVFHVTNTQYIRIKNVSGGAIGIGYDGIQTK